MEQAQGREEGNARRLGRSALLATALQQLLPPSFARHPYSRPPSLQQRTRVDKLAVRGLHDLRRQRVGQRARQEKLVVLQSLHLRSVTCWVARRLEGPPFYAVHLRQRQCLGPLSANALAPGPSPGRPRRGP